MSGAYTGITRRPPILVREKTKIIFQYSLMLSASIVAGWILPRFFGESLWQYANQAITAHFSLPFSNLEGVSAILKITYSYFLPMLACVALIAVFSFSSLSCLVTDGVLIYLGMRTGCSLSVLVSLLKQASLDILALFLFVLFHLLLLSLFWIYSIQAAKYSYQLRVYSKDGRALFPKRVVGALLLHTVLCAAALFLLHLLYEYSIYLVSK